MAVALNQIVIAGNLVRDPELKTVGNTKHCVFSVAINKNYKGSDGSWVKKVTYVPVGVWGKLAEISCKFLSKGKPVLVTGSLSIQNYEDKNGSHRTATEVVADKVIFLQPKEDRTDTENTDTNIYDDYQPF